MDGDRFSASIPLSAVLNEFQLFHDPGRVNPALVSMGWNALRSPHSDEPLSLGPISDSIEGVSIDVQVIRTRPERQVGDRDDGGGHSAKRQVTGDESEWQSSIVYRLSDTLA